MVSALSTAVYFFTLGRTALEFSEVVSHAGVEVAHVVSQACDELTEAISMVSEESRGGVCYLAWFLAEGRRHGGGGLLVNAGTGMQQCSASALSVPLALAVCSCCTRR
jgi:hypothetical protein